MAKAFDKVQHDLLLIKLTSYGVRGPLFNFIKSYLSNRHQKVKINDIFSEDMPVTLEVPQGSVIGPILFLIFINDMPNNLPSNVLLSLFADDSKLALMYKYDYERNILQTGLNTLSDWVSSRNLELAKYKCGVLSVGDSGQSNYVIDYIPLNNINSYTDLGIIINNKLDFSFHINKICKKAYNVSNILFRCFSTVNFKFILKAFITYVRPIVEYNSSLWNPSKRNSMNCVKLDEVQRRFTKCLFSICILGNYDVRLSKLKLISFSNG